MSEATLLLPNMRGGCATVGTTVHTLFRVSGRRHMPMANPAAMAPPTADAAPSPAEVGAHHPADLNPSSNAC
ncbi:MAG: hypothetical protein NT113_10430 [Hyphomicrobiales bacterium]|nr:hypothetical protein [Hyphomicrobiales bacterium]